MQTWAYILTAPGRPSLADQERYAEVMGANTSPRGTVWRDAVKAFKRHATAGRSQLTARNDLLAAARAGDRVVALSPLCLGASPQDVAWFLGALDDKDLTLVVGDGTNDDHVAEFKRLYRNAAVKRSRRSIKV